MNSPGPGYSHEQLLRELAETKKKLVETEKSLAEERQCSQALRQELTHQAVASGWRDGQIQHLARRLTEAEEQERQRLAGALHDDVQQLLVAIKFHLTSLRQVYEDRWGAQPSLDRVTTLIDATLRKARWLVYELNPVALAHRSLADAFEALSARLRADHGLQLSVRQEGSWREPQDPLMRAFLYRCVQELLLNSVKHAQARTARVRLGTQERLLKVVVTDAGQGFDPRRLSTTGHGGTGLGLSAIRERIHSMGGSVQIHSSPSRGTQIVLLLPDNA